jgi:hypothetical protein
MSLSKKGIEFTEEHKKNLSLSNTGRIWIEEQKINLENQRKDEKFNVMCVSNR